MFVLTVKMKDAVLSMVPILPQKVNSLIDVCQQVDGTCQPTVGTKSLVLELRHLSDAGLGKEFNTGCKLKLMVRHLSY